MELRFPLPSRAVSINEVKGRHWSVVRRAVAPWREAVGWAWKTTPPEARAEVTNRRCVVHVTIPFDVTDKQWTGKRRDPHNYVDTIVKALVDQLVQQGTWPDDNADFVEVAEPTLVQGRDVIVTLSPVP